MNRAQEYHDVIAEKITCSLSAKELEAQRNDLIPGLFNKAESVEDIDGGIRFTFNHQPGLVTGLATLIEKERVCCSFLSFRLMTEQGTGPVMLEVLGPPESIDMLKML